MAQATAIEIRGVSKHYGPRKALDGVTLTVPTGIAFGFIGPNGAGKTTIIRCMLGLTDTTAGSISLLGLPQPAQRREALAGVGAIVEEPRFYPYLTGRQNLAIVAAARGPEAVARIDGALRRVGLEGRGTEKVKRYSLGMRQRLGVARCLLADPKLLILDEPTNGLDPAGIREFRQMIRTFVSEGTTVFLSSHLLDEVERTCDQIAIVESGRVIRQNTVAELRTQGEQIVAVETSDDARAAELVRSIEGVTGTSAGAEGIVLRVEGSARAVSARISRTLVDAGLELYRVDPRSESLEEIFLSSTDASEGKQL
jgi:ABC-2 type transport system ATP-binding protein